MRPTQLSYDYPVGGLDPFDVEEPATQQVYYASGWTRAWVPGIDLGPQPDIYDRIPVGYKSLIHIEKLAVVDAGRVVRSWPATDADDRWFRKNVEEGKHDWAQPYWAVPQDPPFRSHVQVGAFPDLDAAVGHAVAHPQQAWLVGRPLENISWH